LKRPQGFDYSRSKKISTVPYESSKFETCWFTTGE